MALFFIGLNLVNADESELAQIGFLGDSLTQGYGLMPEDNFVSQLQKRLDAENYPVALFNYGVSGDTTAGGLERFDWTVSDNISGLVIILGGNDLLRGIAPEHSYQNLKKMLIKAESKKLPILLVGMTASNNFGSTYKKEFDSMYKRLESEFDIFYYKNFFSALDQDNVLLFLSYMQADGLHPNRLGVKKIVNDFFQTFRHFVEHIQKTS